MNARDQPEYARKVLFMDEAGFTRDGIMNFHMWTNKKGTIFTSVSGWAY